MSSKLKNGLLILAISLVLILSYKYAILNSILLKKEYNTLVEDRIKYQNIPEQLALLFDKQVYYDSLLRKMNFGYSSMHNNLLRVINIESDKNMLKVIDFNDPHIFHNSTNQLNTFDFTLEGNFNGILRTIYALEQENNFGEIVHMHFYKDKNYKTNKKYLRARIFIQNIQ